MSQQQLLPPNLANMAALTSTAPIGTKLEPTNTLQPPVSHMKNMNNLQQFQILQSNNNNNTKNPSLVQQLNTNVMGSMLGMGNMNVGGNSGTNGGNMLPSLDKSHNMPMMSVLPMNVMNDKSSIMGLLPSFDDPVEQSLASLEQPGNDAKTDELIASAQRVPMGGHNGTQWAAMNRHNPKSEMLDVANHLDMMMDMSSIINKTVSSQALMHQLGYDNMHHSDGGNNGFGSMDLNGMASLPVVSSGMMMGNMPPMSQSNPMTQPTGVDHMSIFQRASEQMRKSSQNVRRHAENGVGIPTSSVGSIPMRRDAPMRTDSRSQTQRMDVETPRFEADVPMLDVSEAHRFEADASSRSSDSQDSVQRRALAAALSMNLPNPGAGGGGNGITANAGSFRPKPIEELMKPPPSSAAAVNESKANTPHGYSNKSMDHQLKNSLVASSWSSLAAAGSPQNTPTSNKPKPATDSFQAFRNKAKEKLDRQKLLEQQQVNRVHKEAAEKRQQEQQKKRDEVDSVR